MIAKWAVSLGWAALVSLVGSAALATPISATPAGHDLVKVGDPGNASQTQTYATGGLVPLAPCHSA
jgi:hypothetical protein